MSRQPLHKALSEDGNPALETVLKVLKALGLQMRIETARRLEGGRLDPGSLSFLRTGESGVTGQVNS